MDIGRLDTPIYLVRPVTSRDELGAAAVSWERVTERPLWATFTPTTTKDRAGSPRELAVFSGSLTIRFYPGIEAAWCVEMDGHRWKIDGHSVYGRRESIVLAISRVEG